MKKQILFLLMAWMVGIGYGKVYNVGDTIYSHSADINLNSAEPEFFTDEIPLKNATSLSVTWTDTYGNNANCSYSLDGSVYYTYSNLPKENLIEKSTIRFKFSRTRTSTSHVFYNIIVKVTTIADYTRESLTVGNIGTICLPNSVEAGQFSGATFYEVSGKSENEVYFSEVTTLQAGMPYVFCATEQSMSINFTGTFVKAPANHNGLYGVFENYAFSGLSEQELADIFIIKNNTVQKASAASGVSANRAYLKLSEIKPVSSAPEGRTLVLGYEPEESGSQTGVGDIIDEEDAPLIIHTLQGQPVKRVLKSDFYIVNRKEVKYLKAE